MPHATHSRLIARTPRAARSVPSSFGEVDNLAVRGPGLEPDFVAIAESPEFLELRRRFRNFVFPMSAVFLVWYLVYVAIAAYLPEFMSIRLVGEVNVGLVMGVGQFVSTLVITALYLRFASRHIDPRVSELRRATMGGDAR